MLIIEKFSPKEVILKDENNREYKLIALGDNEFDLDLLEDILREKISLHD